MQFEQLNLFDSIATEQPQPPPAPKVQDLAEVVERKEPPHEVYCLEHPIEMIRKIRARKDVIWELDGIPRKWFSSGQVIDCIVVGEPGERAICGITNSQRWSSVIIWWEQRLYREGRARRLSRCDDLFFFENFEIIEWEGEE